jgi:tetratricopeptide (TPR) repeat protein
MIPGQGDTTGLSLGDAEIGDAGLPTLVAGRYQILERIGEGGMGVVCRGFDLDLEETVAVKFLRADLADDDKLRARFRREVKLARRVTHPHVARVFEFGRDGALCFLTMEHVPGESLLALLRREAPLPPSQVLYLAIQLCEGLAAAHDAGVIHGDIKPGNILVAPIRGAVLTDFGISQALSEAGLGDGGGTTGTPFYMAPEQARGEQLRPQTDVYAVGVVLFEALTGAGPWPEGDPLGLLSDKRRGHEPDLARVAPDLPAAWAQLISACLRGQPHERPPDARALLTRLTAMRDAPVPRDTLAAPATSAALGLGDGPRWISVAPLAASEPLAWVAADLTHALGQIRGLRVLTGSSDAVATAARLTGSVTAEPDDDVSVQLELRSGERHTEICVTQPRSSLHQLGAELAARVATALDRTAAPPTHRDSLEPDVLGLYIQARHAYLTMHVERSLQLFETALARAPGHPLLRIGHTLARVQAAMLFREASPAEIAELQAATEEAVQHHGELGEAHLARARVAIALGDTATAARSLCQTVARAPSLVEGYTLLADLLIDLGRLPDAERRLDIALALDPTAFYAWASRMRLLAYRGQWDEFYAHIEGTPKGLQFRTVTIPRLMLWHPRPAAFEQLEQVLATNADNLPTVVLHATRAMVEFALHRAPRTETLDLLETFAFGSTNMRRNAFVCQVNCELACHIGDLPRARAYLMAADRWLLTDWQWIQHCPMLTALRDDPAFPPIRERVRLRADAVSDAIWG